MLLKFRKATETDLSFCDSLHTENMKGYVERLYLWNPTLFRENFISSDYEVIYWQNTPIGFIKVFRKKREIYLGEIQLKKEYQNRGIGTQILPSLMTESKQSRSKLWLKVIKYNPAEKLYQRLGFKVFEESMFHKKMEWQPDNI